MESRNDTSWSAGRQCTSTSAQVWVILLLRASSAPKVPNEGPPRVSPAIVQRCAALLFVLYTQPYVVSRFSSTAGDAPDDLGPFLFQDSKDLFASGTWRDFSIMFPPYLRSSPLAPQREVWN